MLVELPDFTNVDANCVGVLKPTRKGDILIANLSGDVLTIVSASNCEAPPDLTVIANDFIRAGVPLRWLDLGDGAWVHPNAVQKTRYTNTGVAVVDHKDGFICFQNADTQAERIALMRAISDALRTVTPATPAAA